MELATEIKDYDTKKLLAGCAALLEEKKSEHIIVLDLSEINSCFNYFIIVTGSSSPHCKSVAREAYNFMSEHGRKARSKPDLNSSWIILDYDDIVLHVFTEEMRSFYQLEKLWGDAKRVMF